MYLGGNRRWVPLSMKLVGSKFNRDRSDRSDRCLRRYIIWSFWLHSWKPEYTQKAKHLGKNWVHCQFCHSPQTFCRLNLSRLSKKLVCQPQFHHLVQAKKDEWASKLAIKREAKGTESEKERLITSSPLRVANLIFSRNQHQVRPFKQVFDI